MDLSDFINVSYYNTKYYQQLVEGVFMKSLRFRGNMNTLSRVAIATVLAGFHAVGHATSAFADKNPAVDTSASYSHYASAPTYHGTPYLLNALTTCATYPEALNLARKEGGDLPSNRLITEYLRTKSGQGQVDATFIWARELLAYAGREKVFNGGDIVDAETGWTIPASHIPKEAIGKKGIALLVDAGDIQTVNGKIIITPKVVVVLSNFPQVTGPVRIDDNANPIAVSPEELPKIKPDELGFLHRTEKAGVRPILRAVGHYFDSQYGDHIYADDNSCAGAVITNLSDFQKAKNKLWTTY